MQTIIPHITQKIFSLFTDNSGMREHLSRPFLWDKYSCATNSKVLIAINNDYIETPAAACCPDGFRLDALLNDSLNAPADKDIIVSNEDFNRVCKIESVIEKADEMLFVKVGNIMLRASLLQNIIIAAQMLGSSSVSFVKTDKNDKPFGFRMYDDETIVAAGVIMPACLIDEFDSDIKILPLPFQSPIFACDSQINHVKGVEYYNQFLEETRIAEEEYKNSKKVYLVQVVKSAWIPVEAVDPSSAMELAKRHTDGIDDNMFDESNIDIESCNAYPEDDDYVEDLSVQSPTMRQGILTDDGWISWSKYYGDDDPEDPFHKTTTRVSVTFGK